MIHYVTGDATKPQGDSKKLIAHICNDYGGWGRGFVLALTKRWKQPERCYRTAHSNRRDGKSFYRGMVQIVPVEADDIFVANMVAQRGDSTKLNPVAVSYEDLAICLKSVAFYLKTHTGTSLHMPRIGCGLGGGEWGKIEALIKAHLENFEVYVYDLEKKR